jgi:glyoxylase-like metal-dependent hydrolase (beta-lactamase superfamily II)
MHSTLEYFILPVTPFAQNCTLLWDSATRQAAVVDPGGDIDEILAACHERDLQLEKIWLTHGHIDHVGAAAALATRLHLPIEGPQREDAFWLDQLPEQCRMFGFPDTAVPVPDRWLEGGDTLSIGHITFEVLHTPGHTPGHVCFIHRPSKLALVGDVLFAGSIGRTDFPRGDHVALLNAIRTQLFPLGDAFRFIPGHGPLSTFGEERSNNPFVRDFAGS